MKYEKFKRILENITFFGWVYSVVIAFFAIIITKGKVYELQSAVHALSFSQNGVLLSLFHSGIITSIICAIPAIIAFQNKIKTIYTKKEEKLKAEVHEWQNKYVDTTDSLDLYKKLMSISSNQSEEMKELKSEITQLKCLIPSKFPIEAIMKSCSQAAWCKQEGENCYFISTDGKVKLFFRGTVYEPFYECFSPGCNVSYIEEGMDKEKNLYSVDDENTQGSIEDIHEFILRKNVGFVKL